MMPVSNFNNLMEYLQYGDYRNVYIFVILSKTEEKDGDLYGFFKKDRYEYLHYRSGKQVYFFIPGYENDLHGLRIREENYNPIHFVETVKEFERILPFYHYSGGLEMLLIRFDPMTKRIDGRNYSAYKLEDVIDAYGEYRGWRRIDKFFEDAIYYASECDTFRELKNEIDYAFEEAVGDATNRVLNVDEIEKENYVFISHSFKDRDEGGIIGKVKEALNIIGKENWDAVFDIPTGYKYAGVITAAIEKADAVLLLLSENSLSSEHVEREISIAANERKKICPITLSNYDDFKKNRQLYYYLSNVEVTKDYADKRSPEELAAIIGKLINHRRYGE